MIPKSLLVATGSAAGARRRPQRCCRGTIRSALRHIAGAVLGLWLAGPTPATAVTIMVPRDAPTIQAAIDALPPYVRGAPRDSILIEPGTYPERPVIRQPLVLRGLSAGDGAQPTVSAGLLLDDLRDFYLSFIAIRIEDLHVGGAIQCAFDTAPYSNGMGVFVERCQVDSGVTDLPATVGATHWAVRQSTVAGGIHLGLTWEVSVEDNAVTGLVTVTSEIEASITGNRIVDGGLVFGGGHMYSRIARNAIRGGDVGLSALLTGELVIEGNRIEHSGAGIGIEDGEEVFILSNVVSDCGSGIVAAGHGYRGLEGNRVEDCRSGITAGIHVEVAVLRDTVRRCDTGIVLDGSEVRGVEASLVEDCGSGISASRLIGGVSGNTVQRSGSGIALSGIWTSIPIYGNRVEHCPGWGITTTQLAPELVGNRVSFCDEGVNAAGNHDEACTARDNVVLACRGRGLVLQGGALRVEGNIVGRCPGDGIFLAVSRHADIRRNTSYLNGGTGLVVSDGDPEMVQGSVDHNLAFRNVGSGFVLSGGSLIAGGCNDWFENEGGAGHPFPTDFSIDPLFCDVANDDVTLRSDSPLLVAGGCGLIGALGLGCDLPTAVQVAALVAEPVPDGVRVRWQLTSDDPRLEAWIERSDLEPGPWRRIATERIADSDAAVYLDRSVERARSYWYRVAWRATAGAGHSAPVAVSPGAGAPALELRVLGPAPAGGPIEIAYSLPGGGAVDLGVYDLMGRRIATLATGLHGPGAHHARLGVEGNEAFRSGVYFVRLRHPSGQRSRRVIVCP